MASQQTLITGEDGGSLNVSLSTHLPFISFAHITLIEDIPELGPQTCVELTLNVNVSDLFGENRKAKSSGGWVIVDGTRDMPDDTSRPYRIVNPQIPLPNGKTVKSVHLKRRPSYMLSVTAKLKDIKPGKEPRAVRTLLVCDGVVRRNIARPRQAKLSFRKSAKLEGQKVVRFVMLEQFGEIVMQLQRVEQLVGETLTVEVPSSDKPTVGERKQPGQDLKPSSNEEAVAKDVNTEEQGESKGDVSSGKTEEPDVNAEQKNLEYDSADPRYPNVDPKKVWAELTTIANCGTGVGWDVEAQEKNYSRCVF